MAISAAGRAKTGERRLDLPPPFRLVSLREVGDAFQHALAVGDEAGAGTLVHVGRFDLAEFAVVLEPEEPLAEARLAFYAGMVALGDALASFAPPERPIEFVWPDAIRVDGGLVGGGRLGWPASSPADEPPAFLVFAAMIRTVQMAEFSPGLIPIGTALEQEGFEGLDSGGVVESFCRHLMRTLDMWREQGFEALAREYLQRIPRDPTLGRRIDGNGDLLVRHAGQLAARTDRHLFLDRLRTPSWLDPKTGGVRA